MAKLYAELTSDKGGRVASKGGDKSIHIRLVHKNVHIGDLLAFADKKDNIFLSFVGKNNTTHIKS